MKWWLPKLANTAAILLSIFFLMSSTVVCSFLYGKCTYRFTDAMYSTSKLIINSPFSKRQEDFIDVLSALLDQPVPPYAYVFYTSQLVRRKRLVPTRLIGKQYSWSHRKRQRHHKLTTPCTWVALISVLACQGAINVEHRSNDDVAPDADTSHLLVT